MGTTSEVGGSALPLVGAGANTPQEDATVELILAFVGHILTLDIDPKLADYPAIPSKSAPCENRFAYDPREPRGEHIRTSLPSLYVWWDGVSQADERASQYLRYRVRDIHLLYIGAELPKKAGMTTRRGLFNAIDSSIFRWFDHGWHPTFTHNEKEAPQQIEAFIAEPDQLEISYLGGRGVGRFSVRDGNTPLSDTDRGLGRDHPTFAGVFRVRERSDWIPSDHETEDHPTQLCTDGYAILDRTLGGPDGLEDL